MQCLIFSIRKSLHPEVSYLTVLLAFEWGHLWVSIAICRECCILSQPHTWCTLSFTPIPAPSKDAILLGKDKPLRSTGNAPAPSQSCHSPLFFWPWLDSLLSHLQGPIGVCRGQPPVCFPQPELPFNLKLVLFYLHCHLILDTPQSWVRNSQEKQALNKEVLSKAFIS